MKLRWDKWFYGVGTAIIGGGASAVVAGFTTIAIAPATFNLTTLSGAGKVLLCMALNFVVSGALSAFFYLKQAPLPEVIDSDPAAFRKTVEAAVKTEKVAEVIREITSDEAKTTEPKP